MKAFTENVYIGFVESKHRSYRTKGVSRETVSQTVVENVSNLGHVYVGNGEVWYARCANFSTFLPWEAMKDTDQISIIATIPTCPVALAQLPVGQSARVSFILTGLRWLSCGLIPSNDCVSNARRVLRRGGVYTPWWIVTADQLFAWFRKKEYPLVEILGRSTAGDVEAGPRGVPADVPAAFT